ncbi:acyl-CoA thioesterase [Bacillus sp. HMF5848]|uniref:acyl-CoA thioesterase n=1 Tax=Bacillus sp. HMF5848 TaxID=2495421 RepID=UPI000F796268|nr:thioesterase family protein [Bacillus sp. HMF5848]RSK26636.1 acyl-CoA thioesterase [Bacillus sp. HMF5848]
MSYPGFKFSYELRVRYSEIDGQKIVFNAHYLTYIDVAMTEYFRNLLGCDWVQGLHKVPFNPVLVKSTIHYKSSAKLDDLLQIHARTTHIGNSSFTMTYKITRNQEELIDAEIVYVNYDEKNGSSAPLPDTIKEKIAIFEGY